MLQRWATNHWVTVASSRASASGTVVLAYSPAARHTAYSLRVVVPTTSVVEGAVSATAHVRTR
jgi:hypothetical protein